MHCLGTKSFTQTGGLGSCCGWAAARLAADYQQKLQLRFTGWLQGAATGAPQQELAHPEAAVFRPQQQELAQPAKEAATRLDIHGDALRNLGREDAGMLRQALRTP